MTRDFTIAKNLNLHYNMGNMQIEPINFLEKETEKIKSPKPRWLVFLVIFTLIFVGGCITRAIVGEYAPNEPEAYDPATLKPKKPEGFFQTVKYLIFSQDNQLAGAKDDRINILLLGMGGAGHEGPYLTDTIIIASIEPSTGKIAMISIPRDLAVSIPKQGIKKINNANAYGEAKNPGQGGEFASEIISETFDLDIHYYVRIDFKAFAEIIDAVGGVTVAVDRSFTDYTYPAENYEYQTVSFNQGIQTMNGDTALKFVRSRHGSNGEGSDFARARRQQKVLAALKGKLLSFSTLANPLKINNILNSLEKHLTTDLPFADIITLTKMMRELQTDAIINLVLDDSPQGFLKSTFGSDGAFLLVPKTGDFTDINNTIKNIFQTDETVKHLETTPVPVQTTAPPLPTANIEIQNGTWSAGLAARMKKRLEDKNFLVETIGNTAERPQNQSGIYNISNKNLSDLLTALQEELRLPIKEKLPMGISATTSTDILIILGEDLAE